MKLTYCTWGMPRLSVDDALAHISRLGYDGVELTVTKRDTTPFTTELSRLHRAERQRIRRLLDQHGLDLPALAGHADVMAAEPETAADSIARLKETVDLAVDLAGPDGVPAVNTTTGGRSDDWQTQKGILVDRLGELAAYAERRGVAMAIEPHVATMLDHPERVLWMLEQVASPSLQLCFDISHFEIIEGVPMEESVRLLAPHSAFTHVKDQRGIFPHHEFLIPGEGGFDYAAYLKEMQRAGYTGHIGIEVSFMVQARPDYDPYAAAELSYRTLSSAFERVGIARR